MSGDNRQVTFLQYAPPPLKTGEYTITVEQMVNQEGTHKEFKQSRKFAVVGERFQFDPAELHGYFPPDGTNGEYEGVLPQVIFSRRTLPWERASDPAQPAAPWLAVLLFNDSEMPQIVFNPKGKAHDLIECKQSITAVGSDVKGTGTLPSGYCSYPHLNPLDYGQTPEDDCMLLDIPADLFNQVAPCCDDLPYLAHIREVDTAHSADHTTSVLQLAVVMGNRAALPDTRSHAFLVSLENLASVLPDTQGDSHLPAGTQTVRLITYLSWSFSTWPLNQTFKRLAENLNLNPENRTKDGKPRLTTLQLPAAGDPPTAAQIATANAHQSSGQLTADDTRALLWNALAQGYVPLPHALRHGGQTVSWYRSPLTPWGLRASHPLQTTLKAPLSCPDAANRFNPETGMFDVSYGTAWQLGQLLALQNTAYATTLYEWQQHTRQSDVLAAEQRLITDSLGGGKVFSDLLGQRQKRLPLLTDAPVEPPGVIVQWIARLRLLYGVPLSYLVPDERMLPVESMRFFYLDFDWLEALVDGAFSIGRVVAQTEEQHAHNTKLFQAVKQRSIALTRALRPNACAAALEDYKNPTGQVAGVLLRSQLVSGWARLAVQGYLDVQGQQGVPCLRMTRLGPDVMLCLFDGPVKMVTLHEPPEQLHCGVEGAPGAYTSPILRALKPPDTGKQFVTNPAGGSCDDGSCSAAILSRSDKQTLQIAASVTGNVLPELKAYPPNSGLKESDFTSAEWGLEMMKGVTMVTFPLDNGGQSA